MIIDRNKATIEADFAYKGFKCRLIWFGYGCPNIYFKAWDRHGSIISTKCGRQSQSMKRRVMELIDEL